MKTLKYLDARKDKLLVGAAFQSDCVPYMARTAITDN
jgi:hypothetical protein